MNTSAPDRPLAVSVKSIDGELVVGLKDGRSLHVPLEWFPKLRDATPKQLADFRLVGQGVGIHWPQLDEDISVKGLLMPQAQGVHRRTA